MVDYWFAQTSFQLCLFSLAFFSIWCGVYFGIYFPFFIDYSPARCRINSWTDWGSYDRLYHKVHFRKLFVSVEIEGTWYPGFGCEADGSRYGAAPMDTPFDFAYSYSPCSGWVSYNKTKCESAEKFVPRWLCSEWSEKSSFEQGETYECKYTIRHGDSLEGLNDKKTDKSNKYLEVIFDDNIYHKPSYYALMIVCLGLLSILPFLAIVFFFAPGYWDFKVYKVIVYYLKRAIHLLRKYVLVCWKYYDPEIAKVNRKILLKHAAVSCMVGKVHRA